MPSKPTISFWPAGWADSTPSWTGPTCCPWASSKRLAFARLLLNRPRFAVLDEATSALDMDNEANLYRQLAQLGIHYISVGHRRSILNFHDYVLDLQAKDRWRFVPVDQYQTAAAC